MQEIVGITIFLNMLTMFGVIWSTHPIRKKKKKSKTDEEVLDRIQFALFPAAIIAAGGIGLTFANF